MTSKEAIQELRVSLFNRYTDVRIIEAQCNILDKIEKDLEVLELIINNNLIKIKKWNILDDIYQYSIQTDENKIIIDDKKYNLLKEWLGE